MGLCEDSGSCCREPMDDSELRRCCRACSCCACSGLRAACGAATPLLRGPPESSGAAAGRPAGAAGTHAAAAQAASDGPLVLLLLLLLLLLLHQQVPLQELRLELLLSTGISMALRLGDLLLLLQGVSLHHLQGLHVSSHAWEVPLAAHLAAPLP